MSDGSYGVHVRDGYLWVPCDEKQWGSLTTECQTCDCVEQPTVPDGDDDVVSPPPNTPSDPTVFKHLFSYPTANFDAWNIVRQQSSERLFAKQRTVDTIVKPWCITNGYNYIMTTWSIVTSYTKYGIWYLQSQSGSLTSAIQASLVSNSWLCEIVWPTVYYTE